MAGSQLKKLKSELKSQGFIGQTNGKSKSKNNKTPRDREKNQEKLTEIRAKFNVFDNQVNRVKRDVTTIENGKFVTIGKDKSKNTSKTNSFLNKNLQLAYDAFKSRKGRNGKIIDKRFGENSNLGDEDKMLQRFIREREGKKNKFSLESDDEYDDDDDDNTFQLTHSGKVLPDQVSDESGPEDDAPEGPPRKKTKKEVMAEIIAKSKHYKQERQKLFSQTQEQIDELDDEFQDIMGEFQTPNINGNKSSTKTPEEIEYDSKVRDLVYDKRSVPADKTKTEEQKKSEYEEKMKKLEQDRLNRMEGDREAQGDDLDFWNSDDEASQVGDNQDENEDASDEDEEPLEPEEFEDFAIFTKKVDELGLGWVNKIIKNYKPHLKAGNKQRMNQFVLNLFHYLISHPQDELFPVLKNLCESYNEVLVSSIRDYMTVIQNKITTNGLEKKDLIFFVVCGYLFSSSDKYHLIIIPNLILMNEIIINYKNNAILIFIIDTILTYQRIAKRFVPEIKFAIGKLLNDFQSLEFNSDANTNQPINVDEIFNPNGFTNGKLVNKLFSIIDKILNQYKDYSILIEINNLALPYLYQYKELKIGDPTAIDNLTAKMLKINTNTKLTPLLLQNHKQLGIKTFQPKFEENFNPNKVYDNLESSEVNKLKKLVKRETKNQIKDFRKQNKFEAEQQLKEKVKMYDDYHKKMASIVNSISTIEGKERNDYEKEKRRRREKK